MEQRWLWTPERRYLGIGSGVSAPQGRFRRFVSTKAASTLSVGLVAHWHMDEASGTRVDSVSGMNLTETGSVSQQSGKIVPGFSAGFNNNAANYLSRTSGLTALNWNANGQFECNCWIWLNSVSTNQFLLNMVVTSVSNRACTLAYSTSLPSLRLFMNGTQIDFTAVTPSINTWYNVSIGDDGTNSFVYVNNANRQTAARGVIAAGVASSVFFGVTETLSQPANGRVDCCSLWIGRALTTTERTAVYNAGAGQDYPYP